METGRLRGYDVRQGWRAARAQIVESADGATQYRHCYNTNCGPETHVLCVTHAGINRLRTGLPSYNILPSAEIIRLDLPAGREL